MVECVGNGGEALKAISRAELAELLRVFIHPRTDAETLRLTTVYTALKRVLPDDLAQDIARLFKEYDDKAKDRTNAIISIYKKGMADDMAGALKVLLETTGVREEALLQVLHNLRERPAGQDPGFDAFLQRPL